MSIKKDVAVIGGGVVGTAILHALSRYDVDAVLVEKQEDLCEGASKANSGIVCTGFDAKPGTLETRCLMESQRKWPALIEQLKIPYLQCGAAMIAVNEEDRRMIMEKYIPNARMNGVEVYWASAEEIRETNPSISENILGGLIIPGEGVIDPFWATRAFAEIAVLNGAEVRLGAGVCAWEVTSEGFRLVLDNGSVVECRYVVNAAGVWADEISHLFGDASFRLTPRKGQFILTEDPLNLSQIILPVPTPKTKGMLVTPVVFGGFVLGPTTEDQEDKWDRSVTIEGMESIRAGTEKLVSGIRSLSTIRQFAGVRSVHESGDFIIRASDRTSRLIHAAGIRSTGISAAPGIASEVVRQLGQSGLSLRERTSFIAELPDQFAGKSKRPEKLSVFAAVFPKVKSIPHCIGLSVPKHWTGSNAGRGRCWGSAKEMSVYPELWTSSGRIGVWKLSVPYPKACRAAG